MLECWVYELGVQGLVKTAGDGLSGLHHLVEEHECLDTRCYGTHICHLEQRVQVVLQGRDLA